MDMNKFLAEYDEMFGKYPVSEIQSFLEDKIQEVIKEKNKNAAITLYNEMIGLCRSTKDKVRAYSSIEEVLEILKEENITENEEYAISLINIATTYRVFEDYISATNYYIQAEALLKRLPDAKAYSFASLYNNLGLMHFELEDYVMAKECFLKSVIYIENEPTAARQLAITQNHLKLVDIMLKKSYLERSRLYYETFGKPMLAEKFPEYIDRIAVGIVGEGSEKFGLEDSISNDHDLLIGFCMWLSDEDYEEIGERLQQEYEALPVLKSKNCFDVSNAMRRLGVFRINDFYKKLLHLKKAEFDTTSTVFWTHVKEDYLAAATNGQVFEDKEGSFSKIRKELKAYYPQSLWRKKLAEAVHEFSQCGQYNFPRTMARKDLVTAQVCKTNAIDAALRIMYLILGEYAPYYKWRFKGLKGVAAFEPALKDIEELAVLPLQPEIYNGKYNPMKVYSEDKNVAAIERIAEHLLGLLIRKKVVYGENPFLDAYYQDILKLDTIDIIIKEEWQQFDKVQNEGGRAGCQDNWETFSIMRKSQFLAWPLEMIQSFYNDLVTARDEGRNLITEKYGRMMVSTAPEEYERLKPHFPERSEKRIAYQEKIIKAQVAMMEEFAKDFPKMAGNSRSIHTADDTPYTTSYETYLRGELGTYSDKTVQMYGSFIFNLSSLGANLAYLVMSNTAMLYGYRSVADAESKLG